MVVSVIILGFIFQFLSGPYPTASGILSIIFLFAYIFGFESGIGSLFWPLLSVTFPPRYRDTGASLGNVLQWTFNIFLSALFPVVVELTSQAITFWFFGLIGIFCFVFLFFRLDKGPSAPESTEEGIY